MSSDILDYFPLAKIRPVQEQALVGVFDAFESGKKFVILEAPPGVGKSALAVTLARYYRSAYVLTMTKMLQAQYISMFADARELKGRSNFGCTHLKDIVGSCEAGSDLGCTPSDCPYRIAKAEDLLADLTICNYASYLYSVGTMPWLRATLKFDSDVHEDEWAYEENWHRPLLILDEAHGAEEVMLDHISCTIDVSKLKGIVELDFPLPQDGSTTGAFAWLELFSRLPPAPSLGAKARKTFDRLVRKVLFVLDHRDAEKWISEPLSEGRKGFCLKPLTVRSFASRLFKFGERVLLMSATILDAEKMAESLGITDYVYVRVPCPFPLENRPVICASLNMTKAHRGRSWPAMVDQISIILGAHPDEKGLILCPSNEMVDYIIAGLPREKSARMISARGGTRLVDYQRHLDAKGPTVLIAAGFWEGADLKDDFSRFQILPAIPRPYWGGQIAARAQIDPTWYRLQAFSQLVQGIGRSVRSETDSAVSYILDGALKDEDSRADSMLPTWFKEALIYASR